MPAAASAGFAYPTRLLLFSMTTGPSTSIVETRSILAELICYLDLGDDLSEIWLRSIKLKVESDRPDLLDFWETLFFDLPHEGPHVDVSSLDVFQLSVVYEGLTAITSGERRRQLAQYFTPADVSTFIGEKLFEQRPAVVLDPCCGIGNLSAAAIAMFSNPSAMLENWRLNDIDPIAIRTAVALISSLYATDSAQAARLQANATVIDALSADLAVENETAVLMNPPYGRSAALGSQDMYIAFLERFIRVCSIIVAVTPAAYLTTGSGSSVRDHLKNNFSNVDVYCFDNVPDTIFRGFKYGSNNTSKTNFVRAAITVASTKGPVKMVRSTPLMRWRFQSRAQLFRHVSEYLTPVVEGRGGIWSKTTGVGRDLIARGELLQPLGNFVSTVPTDYSIWIAASPRYFISASTRPLSRSSLHRLDFPNRKLMEDAYLLINSSMSYFWWRTWDGHFTLKKADLLSLPFYRGPYGAVRNQLLDRLAEAEGFPVFKRNAGRKIENFKPDGAIVKDIDSFLGLQDYSEFFDLIKTNDMITGMRES